LVSLQGTIDTPRRGLVAPILDGPPARIQRIADGMGAAGPGIDIAAPPLIASAHSHDSAAAAVALVREAKALALMKGSLHTDEAMGAVVAHDIGIGTERCVSHCFVMDVPGHHDPPIITDAAVNIAPMLEEKVDIVRNAIDLACAIGLPDIRVAILSAMETVNPKVPSSIEAAAPCKMADRSQLTGATPTTLWRSTTPSTWTPRRSRTLCRRLPDARTCLLCPTSWPATSLRAVAPSWRRRSAARPPTQPDAGGAATVTTAAKTCYLAP
jgi:hypothetical protein